MNDAAQRQSKILPAAVLGVGSFYAMSKLGPVMVENTINWPSALAGGFGVMCGFAFVSGAFEFLSGSLELAASRTPTGLKGTAGLIKSLNEIKNELVKYGSAPYWGTFNGEPLYISYEASSFTLGPSASGKTTKVVITMILALAGKDKTVIDFKSELTPILAKLLRKLGNNVRIINLGNLYPDLVGPSDEYNVLCLVADLYWKPGGLLEIVDFLYELCLQIYPEPKDGDDKNRYFREGTKRLLAVTIQICILIDGYDATLGDVLQMLNDTRSLRKHLLWLTGRLKNKDGELIPPMPIESSPWVDKHDPKEVKNYTAYIRGMASSVVDMMDTPDNQTFLSFLTGAQDNINSFNITSRAYQKTQKSTFRFAEQKEGKKPTTVFIMIGANKARAQAPVLGLIQWAMLYEIKQHPNKHRPVYLIADEATNIPWDAQLLGSLMTWARSYGLRLHFIFQNFNAFKKALGEDVLQILLSESEIIQLLAGQRNPETLKMIEGMLGEQSLITHSHSDNKGQGMGVNSSNSSEAGRPLMTADEIRRTKKNILIVRNHKPMLVDLPSIAEISPWRKQIDVNPFHGKPYLKPVKLRLKSRKKPLILRLLAWMFKGGHS